MADHRYQQYCPLARALDVVGDRWTLLIVRELIPGHRRFTDLVDGLPGVSRNLLAERLRCLERDGIVTKEDLPPPAARQVYALTDDGRDLAAALSPLILWGSRRMGALQPTDAFRSRWAAVAMSVLGDRTAARGVTETYQFVIGGSAFHIAIDDGDIVVRDGRAADPSVTWTTDEGTWTNIVSGKLTADVAADTGALAIEGDAEAANRLRKIFSRTQMLRLEPRASRSTPRDSR